VKDLYYEVAGNTEPPSRVVLARVELNGLKLFDRLGTVPAASGRTTDVNANPRPETQTKKHRRPGRRNRR
jgi:hypothetical protein